MDSCWVWSGSYFPGGYGQVWSTRLQRSTQAHRLVYETLVGPIPEGLQLDHLCRTRSCVNPAHLRVVTGRENLMAPGSTCLAAKNAAKAYCPRGHAYDDVNTYLHKGRRHCRVCKRAEKRARLSALRSRPAYAAASSSGVEDAVSTGVSASTTSHIGSPGAECS